MPYLRIDPLKVDVGRVADVMSVHYAESRCALPVQVNNSRGGDRHRRALRHRLGRRDRGAHAARACKLVLANPQDVRTLHDRVLRAGQVGARGAEDRRGLGRGQLRAAGRAGQDATSSSTPTTRAWCRWSTGCGSTPSTSAPATSTSSRGATWARSASASTACCTPVYQVPLGVMNAMTSRIKLLGRMDVVETPPPARRPHQDQRPTPPTDRRRGRDAPVDAAHRLRREDGDAHLRPRDGGQEHRGAGLRRARRAALAGADRAAARHHPGHRPDRLGQDDDAVFDAQAAGHRRGQRLHDRRPDRDDRAGLQPDPGAARPSTWASPKACAR